MKRILFLALLAIGLSLMAQPAHAQGVHSDAYIRISPSTPVFDINIGRRDTITATDTTTWIWYAPLNLYVIGAELTAFYADTGAAGPSAVVTIYPFNPTTNIAGAAIITITLTQATAGPIAIAYDNTTTFPVKLSRGTYYKIKYTMGTSDKLGNSKFILYCTQ